MVNYKKNKNVDSFVKAKMQIKPIIAWCSRVLDHNASVCVFLHTSCTRRHVHVQKFKRRQKQVPAVHGLTGRSEKVINTQKRTIPPLWDNDISGCGKEQRTDGSFQRGHMIDSKGTVATNAALQTEFAQIFSPRNWSQNVWLTLVLLNLEYELKFLFTKESPLCKISWTTLIRVGTFLRNPYSYPEQRCCVRLDRLQINRSFLGTNNSINSKWSKTKHMYKWTNEVDKHSNYCKH